MWHEARKQEKKIRNVMNEFYKKRSERRKQYYDIVKTDPMRFLQVHGSKCKIYYDGMENEDSQMMKWMDEIMIDRFDVRAHLDHIPPAQQVPKIEEDELVTKESSEISYERYRVVIQNEFLGLGEDQFLNQLTMEEKFGASVHQTEEKSKKKHSQCTAAIGYNYGGDNSGPSNNSLFSQQVFTADASKESRYDELAKELSDDSDADVDGVIDLQKVTNRDSLELNSVAKKYGLLAGDFTEYFKRDEEQRELSKQMKDQDNEKSTGKKHRRDRKMNRDRRIFIKNLDPPSYAAVEESKPAEIKEESDQTSEGSREPSIEKITFITSFGNDEEENNIPKRDYSGGGLKFNENISKTKSSRNNSYADVVKENYDRIKKINQNETTRNRRYSRGRYSRSRSRSRSRDNHRRRRSPSPDHRRNRRSRSRGRRSRSRSRNRRRYSRSSSSSSDNSRSKVRSESGFRKNNRRSRSRSSGGQSKNNKSYRRERERVSPLPRKYTQENLKNRSPEKSISTTHQRELKKPQKSEALTSTVSAPAVSVMPSLIPSTEEIPVKRYYGRRKSNESTSSLSASSGDERKKKNSNNESPKFRSADTKVKSTSNTSKTSDSSSANTLREKLKRKMQLLLNKQFKADKRAENERKVREKQQQLEREEEMRELSLKLRKKQREKRHSMYGGDRRSASQSSSGDNDEPNDPKSSQRKRRSSSSSSTSSSDRDQSRR